MSGANQTMTDREVRDIEIFLSKIEEEIQWTRQELARIPDETTARGHISRYAAIQRNLGWIRSWASHANNRTQVARDRIEKEI